MNEPIEPPRQFTRILSAVGPGLIVAGSIVGSGELIATTKTGAEAGFSLLWLIMLGCVIKVFAQIEFGRYAIISGKTTLMALDEVPGPRIQGRGNWLVWYWLVMWLASISQLGGIVGGVGQALAITAPLTEQGKAFNQAADAEQLAKFEEFRALRQATENGELPEAGTVAEYWNEYDAEYPPGEEGRSETNDAAIWAVIIAVLTSLILVVGRYGLIQSFSTALVASFTLLVVVNVYFLQSEAEFAFSAKEFISGLTFDLPSKSEGINPIATALATFGIIGVGAAELITYPYWCLEKGYGRFTGDNDGSPEWKRRAAGWMRVMKFDAWGAMIIYTFATMAFFLLGASVLHRIGLNPEKGAMVRTLAVMFQPVFSEWAAAIFLFGAIAVLYSTFFVANASHARTFADCLRVIGIVDHSEATYQRWVKILSGVFPLLCVVIFLKFQSPAKLVLISGITQGVMLPMLAGAALYFRYNRCIEELRPSKIWDICLWLSAVAMLVTGTWTVVSVLGLN
ncbi:Nramp family divalent metal transporter [Stieleria sp. JC731]|uniref:Nramp family divalent metal transporter n=1 Tax=Pirellulaceae TaxID=2691357 RepID=UPI001E344227|nr:Nramp family divalent metal transporter [Stieleria sp. JC731]MCC9603804.1 Nramp family divalent metal transporter [Stieleria sp. JC731]